MDSLYGNENEVYSSGICLPLKVLLGIPGGLLGIPWWLELWHFHCRGPKLSPWWGSYDPASHETWLSSLGAPPRPSFYLSTYVLLILAVSDCSFILSFHLCFSYSPASFFLFCKVNHVLPFFTPVLSSRPIFFYPDSPVYSVEQKYLLFTSFHLIYQQLLFK